MPAPARCRASQPIATEPPPAPQIGEPVTRVLRRFRLVFNAVKTHFQQVLTAVALNLLRVLDWLAEVPRAKTRTSAFVRLMVASP